MGLLLNIIFISLYSATSRPLVIDSGKEELDSNLPMWGLPLNGVNILYIYVCMYVCMYV